MKTIKIILTNALLFFLTSALYNCGGNDGDPAKNSINITSISHESPATLKFNEFVVITYDYNILSEDGARMWIIPYTDGSKSPGFLYSSSKIYSGSGTREVGVSIDAGDDPVMVDQFQVLMVNPDQSETFLERFENVDYTFDE